MVASLGGDVVLAAAGTVIAASATSAALYLGNKGTLRAQVVVTAVSGTTPSDTITVQTSHDNGVADAWRSVGAFPAQTAAGSSPFQSFAGLDRYVRLSHAVTGTTPSLTLSVLGEAF